MLRSRPVVFLATASVLAIAASSMAACTDPRDESSEGAVALVASASGSAAGSATPPEERAGISFRDYPGDSKHAVEGSPDAFVEKLYSPGPTYTFKLTSPRGSFALPSLLVVGFPINPIGGAHQLPGRSEVVVCNTAFRELTPTRIANVVTSCVVYRPDGTVAARRQIAGAWFKAFAVRSGRLEIRTVPRLAYFSESPTGPDCNAIDVTTTSLTPRAELAYCNPARDPGTPCFTSKEAQTKSPSTPDGRRDERGYCVAP